MLVSRGIIFRGHIFGRSYIRDFTVFWNEARFHMTKMSQPNYVKLSLKLDQSLPPFQLLSIL